MITPADRLCSLLSESRYPQLPRRAQAGRPETRHSLQALHRPRRSLHQQSHPHRLRQPGHPAPACQALRGLEQRQGRALHPHHRSRVLKAPLRSATTAPALSMISTASSRAGSRRSTICARTVPRRSVRRPALPRPPAHCARSRQDSTSRPSSLLASPARCAKTAPCALTGLFTKSI